VKLLQEQETSALKSINHDQPQPQEIELAVARLTAIIESERSYASAWNNRAQARRLLVAEEKLSQNPSTTAEIFADLAQAISLATPTKANKTLSIMDARILASAHTHRGYLLLLASKSEENRKMLANVPGLRDLSIHDLEEAASREFAKGGRYGNETARQLAVKTNPYAKLCGSIVREALTKEISDFYHPQLHS
jgi:predicted nucleic acid-binding protein